MSSVDEGRLREAVRAYGDNGYAVLTGVFGPEEVENWRRECERLAKALNEVDEHDLRIQSRGHHERDMVRDRYDPVSEFSPLFPGPDLRSAVA